MSRRIKNSPFILSNKITRPKILLENKDIIEMGGKFEKRRKD